jgi:protein phosphatase 1G
MGKNGMTIQITKDHTPKDPGEVERIFRAGMHVWGGRIQGNLNVSRGLGDHRFKSNPYMPEEGQALTANPDTFVESITNIDFILLGCDGIYEKYSNQYIGKYIYDKMEEGVKDPQLILRQFLKENVADENKSRYRGGPNREKGTDN